MFVSLRSVFALMHNLIHARPQSLPNKIGIRELASMLALVPASLAIESVGSLRLCLPKSTPQALVPI